MGRDLRVVLFCVFAGDGKKRSDVDGGTKRKSFPPPFLMLF